MIAAATEAGHAPPKVALLELDITSRSSIAAAADKVRHDFEGKLDILINNAAVLEKWLPILESDESEYWKTWEVNYRGIYWMTKSFLPLLLDEGQGQGLKTIVNVTSIGAHNLSYGASAYQCSKSATIKFGEFVMAEYGLKGVLCFSVHPGGVKTDIALNMPAAMHTCKLDFLVPFILSQFCKHDPR